MDSRRITRFAFPAPFFVLLTEVLANSFVVCNIAIEKEDCYNPYGEATLYDTANIG